METKKLTYEAPEAQVFGVETQENFLASGGSSASISNMDMENGAWDETTY